MKTFTIIFGVLVVVGLAKSQLSEPVTEPSEKVCESKGGSCVGLNDGTLIPFKGNCTKFIQCFQGCGFDNDCLEGTHFNTKLGVCDWPYNAGCVA